MNKELIDLCREYLDLISFKKSYYNTNLYSLDQRRIELHRAIAEKMGLTEEETRIITDNLWSCDKDWTADDLIIALQKIKSNKEQEKQ